MAPTKINKHGAIAKVKILVFDTIKQLKTFKIISNEMPILFLILCWWYFSCLQMYSEKFLNIEFYEQIFFSNLGGKGRHMLDFLRNNSLWKVYTSFINKPPGFLEVSVLII